MKYIVAAILALLLAGCVQTARLYNTDTGEVLTAKYTNSGMGHGTITLITKEGKTLTGEYTTIDNTSYGWGFGSGTVASGGQYAWASAQGFSFSSPGVQYGSAICTGEGLVIEIVYQTSVWTGHGTGVGKDNKGGKYRLQF